MLKSVHSLSTSLGLHPVTWLDWVYGNTTVFRFPSTEGHVALTIDDGLCRSGSDSSMITEVRQLLKEHSAKATFFLCSDYVDGFEEDAKGLLADGHEFANHCPSDGVDYYNMQPDEFEAELLKTSRKIQEVSGEVPRWFRAPQGKYSGTMHGAVSKHGMHHALGDCYCDDWAVEDSEWVARTMLAQVRSGSVLIAHMPERGFREHIFRALELILQGLRQRDLSVVTLSALEAGAAQAVPVPRALAKHPNQRGKLENQAWETGISGYAVISHHNFGMVDGVVFSDKEQALAHWNRLSIFSAHMLLGPDGTELRYYGKRSGRDHEMKQWWENHAGRTHSQIIQVILAGMAGPYAGRSMVVHSWEHCSFKSLFLVICAAEESGPYLFDEEAVRGKQHCALAPPAGRFGGVLWYHSLYWTNFPPLGFLEEDSADSDVEFRESLLAVNPDGPLADQFVSYGAAREHLCQHGRMPQEPLTLWVEVMQYDGVHDRGWHFPLQDFIPKRGNHTPYDIQSRRGYENGAMTLGLNAEDFSDSVLPVSDLSVVVTVSDEPEGTKRLRASEGHQFALLSVGGWPFRIRRIGTFEGLGHVGRLELQLGSGEFSEEVLWQLLEGGKRAPGGICEEGSARSGCKYWCQLYDLDWLGPKRDENLAIDPEIPPHKGYVWFRVLESTMLAGTSKRAVHVQLLEDGIVPAWLDLRYLQVWAGDMPLGYLNQVFGELQDPPCRARVVRTVKEGTDDRGVRKVHVRNSRSSLVFEDPLVCDSNGLVDLGWALHGIGYRGARVSLSMYPGAWVCDKKRICALIGEHW
ncbi:unnamed protein product [Symbiodinium pilosum]|uniref:NodB homology domain-containing protein n=1 Tax=Symbiodinium pilosum TaxID=2952 RepID=A0A812LQ33_SYMPI|nr:unnamed protein product [Symbiodinium pilosum]